MPEEPAAPPLSLGGSLADFPLADVLTFLNMGQKTGAIEIYTPKSASRLYLKDGEVIYARSRSPRFQLPAFLKARGVLTEQQASQLEERSQRDGSGAVETAVSMGLIPKPDMSSLEKILASEIAFDAMRWREGKFAFLRDYAPEGAFTELRISAMNLILEGARRLDEASRLASEPDFDRTLVVSLACAAGTLEDQVVLNAVEWAIVALINGKRTVDDIFGLSGVNEPETWSTLQRLKAARLIVLTPAEAPERSERPPEPAPTATQLVPSVKPGDVSRDELPTRPSWVPPTDVAEDVRLISGKEVTTSHGFFGVRTSARLVEVVEGREPMVFELLRPVLIIGRTDSNDFVLPHGSVSKQHARLTQIGARWRVEDLGSTNGTVVNGHRVGEHLLEKGDGLKIGAYQFRFDAVETVVSAEIRRSR